MLDLFPGSPKKQTITEVMPNRSWIFSTRDLGQLLFAALGPNSAPTNPVPSPNFAIHELVPRSPCCEFDVPLSPTRPWARRQSTSIAAS